MLPQSPTETATTPHAKRWAELAQRKPRSSLRRRLLLLLAVVAVVPSVVCLVSFQRLISSELMEKERREGDVLAGFLALSLSGRMADYHTRAGDLLDIVKRDDRVAFALVTDPTGFPLHFGVQDARAFDVFRASSCFDAKGRRIEVSGNQPAGAFGGATVRIAPIPAPVGGGAEGYIVLGIHEPLVRRLVEEYGLAQIAAVCLATLLAVPVAAAMLRRWTSPLAQLAAAARQLAGGSDPRLVNVSSQDEVGHLAANFNDMALRLGQARRDLMSLNSTLERQVDDRTREVKEAMSRLETVAMTDPLTGLYNRRAFESAFADLFSRSAARSGDLAVVAIDLDGFKQVNDKHGHETGDQVLIVAAECLRARTRTSDVCARLGGDEFVVLMPRVDSSTARDAAERMRLGFHEDLAERFRDAPISPVSMSMGMACLADSGATASEQLLAAADSALYAAKRAGKARLVVKEAAAKPGSDDPRAQAA